MFIAIMDVISIILIVIAEAVNVIFLFNGIFIAIIVGKKFRAKIHILNYALVSNVVHSNIKGFILFFSYIQINIYFIYFNK
jgi:hypothetical protein